MYRYKPIHVANYIVLKSLQDEIFIDFVKLNYLTAICQGLYVLTYNTHLFLEPVFAMCYKRRVEALEPKNSKNYKKLLKVLSESGFPIMLDRQTGPFIESLHSEFKIKHEYTDFFKCEGDEIINKYLLSNIYNLGGDEYLEEGVLYYPSLVEDDEESMELIDKVWNKLKNKSTEELLLFLRGEGKSMRTANKNKKVILRNEIANDVRELFFSDPKSKKSNILEIGK